MISSILADPAALLLAGCCFAALYWYTSNDSQAFIPSKLQLASTPAIPPLNNRVVFLPSSPIAENKREKSAWSISQIFASIIAGFYWLFSAFTCFQTTPTTSISKEEEIKSLLEQQPLLFPVQQAEQLLDDNAKVYADAHGLFDKTKIFDQVNCDLRRDHYGMSSIKFIAPDNQTVPITDADSIFTALCQYTQGDEQRALKILSTFQQGVFAKIQMQILNDLGLLGGMDAKFVFSGHSQKLEGWAKEHNHSLREYRLDITKGVIECDAYGEIRHNDPNSNADDPRAIIKAHVEIDLKSNTASESWHFEEI